MADDGLTLNFELPSHVFAAPRAKLKGGSWKDRLTARKSQEYGRKKAQERALGEFESTKTEQTGPSPRSAQPPVDGRPAKRARIGHDVLPKSTNGEIISSLFSFNQTAAAPVGEPAAVDEAPVEPTNAPLDDETAKFTSLGLSDTLASHLLRKLEIRAPTAIQRKAVKQLCENDTDAFLQAQTGSGKTLAYLLPIVERISTISKQMKSSGQDFSRDSGLFAIVLAPTRELSKQIASVLESLLSCYPWIVAGTVIGGEKKKSEKARLRKGLNILVATPGRMVDHLEHTETLDLSHVRWLVLDEGDRLMELGFEQDIQKIVSVLNLRARKRVVKPLPGLPERRTTVLCSATIKASVEQLHSISLKDPVSLAIDANDVEAASGSNDSHDAKTSNFSAPAQLKQSYVIVPPKQRLVTLMAVLKQAFRRKGSVMKCIVFMSCADSVDFHFELLTRGDGRAAQEEMPRGKRPHQPVKQQSDPRKIPQGTTIAETRVQGKASVISSPDNQVEAYRLHGSLQQATRTMTLKAFSASKEPAVLVCTDVAARGLDLPDIDLVVEYDAPFSKDDHLHRIGRTARAGRDGRATIFLQPGCEEGYIAILKESKPRNLTRHDSDELLKKAFSPSSGVVGQDDWEQGATDFQMEMERWCAEHPKHLEQARRAYQSHIRAYATHVSAERHIFNLQELHLGHLAKAFALRDKPGSIRVPGSRPSAGAAKRGKGDVNKRSSASSSSASAAAAASTAHKRKSNIHDDVPGEVDAQDAKRKMHAMATKMCGVSEFNLG